MGKGPLRALLKGKDFYQRVERGILKFQVTHSCSRSDHPAKWEKTDVGRQDCERFSRGRRHPCVGVWRLHQTGGNQPNTPGLGQWAPSKTLDHILAPGEGPECLIVSNKGFQLSDVFFCFY